MLFNEFALTPQLFSKDYCERDSVTGKEILYFLKQLRTNGLIANINKNQWMKAVIEYRNELSPEYRDKLSKVFEYLQDHHRIVEHETVVEENISSEMDWLNVAMKEDEIKPYAAMLFTGEVEKPNSKTYTVEEVMEHDLLDGLSTGLNLVHAIENIRKHVEDFLLYAKKLTIIDPYFTYNQKDDDALMMYAELFGKRRGNRYKNKKMIVHTLYNTKDRYHDPDSDAYKDRWITVCKRIHEKYHHRITINLWDDRSMHDRFMITNQGGISAGRGFGINEKLDSYWVLMDDNTRSQKLNYFNPNVNPNIKLVLSLNESSTFSSSYIVPKMGKVKKIIHDNERGKVGYIETDTEEYYFQIPGNHYLTPEIMPGKEVEFEVRENYRGEVAFIKNVY